MTAPQAKRLILVLLIAFAAAPVTRAELTVETVESSTSKIEWTRLPAISDPFELTASRKVCVRQDASPGPLPGQPSRSPAQTGVRLSSIDPENPMTVLGKLPDDKDDATTTRFQTLTGPLGTFNVPNGGPRLRDIRDGSSNTLLVVQVGADKAVPWTKPVDAKVDAEKPLACLGRLSGPAFVTLMADGAVRTWHTSITATLFRALATPQGGEVLKSSDLRAAEVK